MTPEEALRRLDLDPGQAVAVMGEGGEPYRLAARRAGLRAEERGRCDAVIALDPGADPAAWRDRLNPGGRLALIAAGDGEEAFQRLQRTSWSVLAREEAAGGHCLIVATPTDESQQS